MTKKFDGKRVAKNTIYLYFRTLIVMGVSVFTSRIVLDALGVGDYGIYNVVGGFVAMFSVFSGTLIAASQRFIAYELGCEKPDVRRVFSTTLNIHIILAFFTFILLESFGLWFLNNRMNIGPERLTAANWVFQCSVMTFCINLISIPYTAAIVAYEKMSAFAYISIFEVMAKLACVYLLYCIDYDSLVVYAVFMLLISVILRMMYSWYCHSQFKDCRYSFVLDRKVFRKMIGFCGWNFIGSTAAVMNVQGINLLINLFFGVILNAARGISSQIDSAINTFVANFTMALNPQITKSYAAGDFVNVNRMIILGTKFSFFLFLILCLPVFLNTEYILSIWLKQVPDQTALFVRCAIIYSMCQCLSQCLYTAMLATGHIKKYQIIVGTLSLIAFPITYVFFKMGFPAEFGYISMIISSLICLIARLFLLQDMVIDFSVRRFLKDVLLPVISSLFPTVCIIECIHYYINEITFFNFVIESLACWGISLFFICLLGLKQVERAYVLRLLNRKVLRRK